MHNDGLVERTAAHMRGLMGQEGSGHDWWHIYRVWRLAVEIARAEGGDLEVVELAALLHDIADWKFHGGDEQIGSQRARQWLESLGAEERIVSAVEEIVLHISYKGAGVQEYTAMPLEGKIVQDADRLDAIGAIGIARAFAYGGHAGRLIHDPEAAVTLHQSATAYHNSGSPTINHFYEKLLLLKDRINTPTARRMAEHRHRVMEDYLEEFYAEWDGQR